MRINARLDRLEAAHIPEPALDPPAGFTETAEGGYSTWRAVRVV